MQMGEEEVKLSAFVDDTILCVENHKDLPPNNLINQLSKGVGTKNSYISVY